MAQTENFQEITVQGTVVDATDEEALADVTVLLLELNQQTQTDSDGQFSFKSIPEGEMMDGTLHIDHEGYEELSTTVRLDQNQRITLELTPKSETE